MEPRLLLALALSLAAAAALAQDTPPAPATGLVTSFETETDNPFELRGNITGTRVAEHVTHGQGALRVIAKGADQPSWPALWLFPKTEPDWSRRTLLVMDLFLETADPVELGAQLTVLDRPDAVTVSLGRLQPGWNKGVTLCLQDFGRDLRRVASLALYLASPRRDVVYTIDHVRWEAAMASDPDGWVSVTETGASGSDFETTAATTADSNQITVADVGDLQVGQQISVSKCNVRYLKATQYGPGEPYATARPSGDDAALRGYDGSTGGWLTVLAEIDGAAPATFRWKTDLAKSWAAAKVPVTGDWQPLADGLEIRFQPREWQPGQLLTFSARDQLITTIDRIEGRVLTLAHPANRTVADAVVRHTDRDAVQRAIDQALRRKSNVFFPAGRYRIPGGLRVTNAAAIRLEGANAATTILDISDGEGSCFALQRGTEVTIRNFTMVGHTGLAEAPLAFTTGSGYGFWPNSLKGCNAVGINGTERVLIENVHARRMANECFYAQGPAREGDKEPEQYQKSLTYLRCSVTDCAANAFNNNDRGENTSLLHCRVDGAGWHAAEMPARFLRVMDCYFRNTGAVTVGDMSHRYEDLNELGCGQAMICRNVFEGIGRCGGIAVNHGSSQVVIADNLFINFNGPAITVSSQTVRPALPWFKPDAPVSWGSYPSRGAIIRGNLIDLTSAGEDARSRTGISVDASDVTIADNQIYVRGQADPKVTGLRLGEPALRLNVHNNLVRNCGTGLVTTRAASRVTQVIDPSTFLEAALPLEWRYTHQYQGWQVLWLSGDQVSGTSTIEAYDPTSLRFRLTAPRELKVGDAFEIRPPGPADWNLHDNTITACLRPVVLGSYGSETSRFADNLISRGSATGVEAAVVVAGRFELRGNQIQGFDEVGGSGLQLRPDRAGQPLANLYRDNLFSGCAVAVGETAPGLWRAARRVGNVFVDCGAGPPEE